MCSQHADTYSQAVVVQINLKGLDGIQGPVYVGTGCVFRRTALYGYEPPLKENEKNKKSGCCSSFCCGPRKGKQNRPSTKLNKRNKKQNKKAPARTDSTIPIFNLEDIEEGMEYRHTTLPLSHHKLGWNHYRISSLL